MGIFDGALKTLRGASSAIGNALDPINIAKTAINAPAQAAKAITGQTPSSVMQQLKAPGTYNGRTLTNQNKPTSLAGTPTSAPTYYPGTTPVGGPTTTNVPLTGLLAGTHTTSTTMPQMVGTKPITNGGGSWGGEPTVTKPVVPVDTRMTGGVSGGSTTSPITAATITPPAPVVPPLPTTAPVPTSPTTMPASDTNTMPVGPSVIDQLRSKVTSLSSPGAEEQQLKDELAQIQGADTMAVAGLEGQGRGIPVGLVRGQQAVLQQQNATKEQTLLDRIAAASANRQAQLQAASQDYQMASDAQARQDKLTSPTTVGNQILQFDPATGQYKTLYSAPETAKDQPATVQEYEYAKNNGYDGSFLDYQAAKNAATSSGSSSGGFTLGNTRYDAQGNVIATAPGGASSLSATQQTAVAGMDSTSQAIDAAMGLIAQGGFTGGPVAGLAHGILGPLDQNQTRNQVDAALTMIKANYQKGLSGAGVSDKEVIRLSNALPSITDPIETIKTKLNGLTAELARQKEALLNTAGSGASSATSDNPNAWSQEEKQYYLQSGGDPTVFRNDLSTSQNGSKDFQSVMASIPPGTKAGQCAHVVNQGTGFHMGDSYASKEAYINPSIKVPQKGDVFVMPIKGSPYGHTGFVLGTSYKPNGQPDQVTVYDSNWYEKSRPETVAVHKIPYSDIAGYARPNA